jgi:predicted RND superfamily exporter protein
MDEKIEKAYTPKEVFTTLDIGDSTLRKWCLALEKNGYEFIRNDKNSRIYVEGDLVVLRHFQNLVKENMPLDNASKLVVDRFGKGTFEVSTVSVPVEKTKERHDLDRSNNEDIKELKGLVENQNELIKELISRMDQQQKYIDEKLEIRDKKLMESLRESQEERKALLQIAAAQEEEKKKGFLARLFYR